MDSLKSYLCHSIEFVLNRLNDRFHESENGIGYLVTHIDRILYIISCASSLFNIPPELEFSLQRAHQMLVVLGGDDNSLQRRFFKFSGCRGRPSTDFKKRGRGGPEKREDLGWTGESTAFQAREICS